MGTYPVTIGEISPDISALGAANTVTHGLTPALGTSTQYLQSDATIQFPTSLESAANSTTLALTDDGIQQTITGSLGNQVLVPGSGGQIVLDVNQTTGPTTTATIRIRPGVGNLKGLNTSVFSSNFAQAGNQTLSSWDAQISWANAKIGDSAGGFNGTLVGYDQTVFTISPTSGSGTANIAYSMRLSGALINNASGAWAEVAGITITGPRRGLSNPSVTIAETIVLECPTISATDQMGIYVKQRSGQQVATNRYGVKVDAHNSGTNRWGMWTGNKVHCDLSDFIANASGFGFCNKDSQSSSVGGGGTARYWRSFVDASATGVAGDAFIAIDSLGNVTGSRAGGATGTLLITFKDVGTSPVQT